MNCNWKLQTLGGHEVKKRVNPKLNQDIKKFGRTIIGTLQNDIC